MIPNGQGDILRCSKAAVSFTAVAILAGLLLWPGRGATVASPVLVAAAGASDRLVAIADVHGDCDQFVAILKRMGLVDDRLKWAGGSTILVQLGDIPDRGPDTRKALDLLMELELEAPSAGGKVISLLGNHEVMMMMGDTRYTTPAEFQAFATEQSEKVRDAAYQDYRKFIAASRRVRDVPDDEAAHQQWLARHPLGFFEQRDAYGPNGIYGRRLRAHDSILALDGVLFLHAGLDPELRLGSVEEMNKKIRSQIADFDKLWQALVAEKIIWKYMTMDEAFSQVKLAYQAAVSSSSAAGVDLDELRRLFDLPKGLLMSDQSPLWYRAWALDPEDKNEKGLTKLFQRLGAHAMVVGHTVLPAHQVTARFSNRVFLIDTGMSKTYFAGRASALEINGGKITAYYADDPSPHVLAGPGGAAEPKTPQSSLLSHLQFAL